MDLSIIIVSWNTRALLEQCLRSIYDKPPSGDFEIFVIDNASTDDSAAMVVREFPGVVLVDNTENVGFARANNQAIERSTGRYLLLLNPDTVILDRAFSALIEFMDRNQEAGAAGPRLLNPDHTLQTSCYPLPTLSREFWRLFHLDKLKAYGSYPMARWAEKGPRQVEVIQGACIVLRKSALDQVGVLDEDYFIYTEEVDLCYRLQRAGWKLFWIPDAAVIHYGEQSTKQLAPEMFLRLYESKVIFFRKHYGPVSLMAYKGILVFAALARLAALPLAVFEKPVMRKQYLLLARNYRNLIRRIPQM